MRDDVRVFEPNLETLKFVKQIFSIHSDMSTKCNGYNSLCQMIDQLEGNLISDISEDDQDKVDHYIKEFSKSSIIGPYVDPIIKKGGLLNTLLFSNKNYGGSSLTKEVFDLINNICDKENVMVSSYPTFIYEERPYSVSSRNFSDIDEIYKFIDECVGIIIIYNITKYMVNDNESYWRLRYVIPQTTNG